MIIRLKHFHDSLNIALIVAFSRKFFCAKCVQFLLNITELNLMKDVFPWELLSFIFSIKLTKI